MNEDSTETNDKLDNSEIYATQSEMAIVGCTSGAQSRSHVKPKRGNRVIPQYTKGGSTIFSLLVVLDLQMTLAWTGLEKFKSDGSLYILY